MKFIRTGTLALAGMAAGAMLLAAYPAAAQEESAAEGGEEAGEALPDFDALDGGQALALFRSTEDRWQRDPCRFGAPLLSAMKRGIPDNPLIARLSLFAQALCADEENRYDDGLALIRQYNALDPEEPAVSISLYFADRAEDADYALELISDLEGEALGELDPRIFWYPVRMIERAGRRSDFEAIAFKWFDQSQIAFLDGDMHAALAMNALRHAAREGRADKADELLGYITSPRAYVDMLLMRQYEPLWPWIEARAGQNLTAVGSEDIAMTRARLANAPGDRDRFSDAAHALHFHGDFAEAAALAQSWTAREEAGAEMEEGDAWALNIQAYAFDSMGQVERADAIFERLAEVDPEANPWVVSFVINRASRLVGQGRWEEGLAASEYARTVPGSPYAEMIVARDHACALLKLGRAEEAAAEVQFLRENSREGIGLAATGLLCAGERDEAAELLVAGLRDDVLRSGAIEALQQTEADLFYSQSMLPSARALLAEYPELAALYYEHARDLPDIFIPRAALRREQLALPDWE